jgi:hopanoid C-2 methylase
LASWIDAGVEEVSLRCSVPIKNSRNILCVFPAYTPSFGTFAHAFELVPGVRAFMPPQGLLVVAAYLPERLQVRFIDENIERAELSDVDWADVVLVGGMHIQAPQIHDIQLRAKSFAKLTVLGGSAVSSSPETYPEFDYSYCVTSWLFGNRGIGAVAGRYFGPT